MEDQKFKISKKEFRTYEKHGTKGYEEKHFTFMDPIPVEMRSLKLDDLYTVSIDWKMLTSLRPKLKVDEEYFSRYVFIFNLPVFGLCTYDGLLTSVEMHFFLIYQVFNYAIVNKELHSFFYQ